MELPASTPPDCSMDLIDLPSEILCRIASLVVRERGCPLVGVCVALDEALGEAVREELPGLLGGAQPTEGSRNGWSLALAAVQRGLTGTWRAVQPLRAKRPATSTSEPLQAAPKLSGASMCAMGPVGQQRLVVYGGRSATTGDTHDKLRMATVSWRGERGVASWSELLVAGPSPPARCYHTATRLGDAMLVFGGAGAESEGEALHADTWLLKRTHPNGGGGFGDGPLAWQPLSGAAPAARSSHVAAAWVNPEGETVVLVHGGLGSEGTRDDTWRFVRGAWEPLKATGGEVARSHHCGGVVGDHFLIHSGQDERLLTVSGVCCLHLRLCQWSQLMPPAFSPAKPCPPRIDASAVGVGGVGLVVFGGVGATFEFEEPTPWVLRMPAPSGDVDWRTALPRAGSGGGGGGSGAAVAAARPAPGVRACTAVCADGARLMFLGGFDGNADLSDLWCLDLLPPSLRHTNGAADAKTAAASPAASSAKADAEAALAAELRARRTRQASVLHSTKAAAGHNCHIRVFQAGQDGAQDTANEQARDGSAAMPADDGTELIRRALACRLGGIRLNAE